MSLHTTIKSASTPKSGLYRRRSVPYHFHSSHMFCKAMLLVLAMLILDIGGDVLPLDDTNGSGGSFGLIQPVAANPDPCIEFDIPKPLRFGKREAYINRYRNSNKCNSKRVSVNDLQSEQIQLRQFLEELNRANINSQLLNKIPSSEIWQKIMRSYRLGTLGTVFRPQNSDSLTNKNDLTELQTPSDVSEPSYSTID